MKLAKDLREFIASLNSNRVEYLVVGAFALAYHGRPRFTGDLDIWVRPAPENATRVLDAFRQFGFPTGDLTVDDFTRQESVVQIGFPPVRIDVLSSIDGVSFDEAWATRVAGELSGLTVQFIGRAEFVKNKRATGRVRDLADADALGEE